jgi:hypothetical protein
MSVDRTKTLLAAGALALLALALGACSVSLSDLPLVGTPADAPTHSKEAEPYLPVEDLPPGRDQATIAPADRDKMKAELLAARDRQASATASKDAAAKVTAAKDTAAKDTAAKDTAKKCPSTDTGAAGRPC